MEIDHPTVPPFDISLKLPLEESFSSLSPDSLYSYSLEEYTNFANNSYNTDFSADSPLSLGSPVSPTTSCINPNTTVLGFDNTWAALEQPDIDDLAFIKPEPADSPLTFAAFPSAIDPIQLSGSPDEDLFAIAAAPRSSSSSHTHAHSRSLTNTRSNHAAMPSPRERRSYSVRKSSSAGAQRKGSSGSSSSSASLKRKSISGPAAPLSPSSASSMQQQQQQQQSSVSTYEPPKKTAHNLIEKRYRTNLNDKILALRDAVPALRVVARQADAGSEDDDEEQQHQQQLARYSGISGAVIGEDLGGLAPAHKLNKATILGKATEYIAHLERRNEMLARENESLRGKVGDYEMFVMSRRM
ncbi:sterol regulatory element-binding protein sre1 [Grosmannia clavigera kw1407]|uniref:Sterol regulatory element-binding protein sre1 n=1 Tax=Grosmannia clavigera (strain kw1407 / UAMH 11150) TaxID=655863 RepID=F0XAZ5_GROCL|nr:sterol regulatory element-binding protein sre1 [Grosmannia clavigera kw1407]EFX05156.1 sterol regulatory element-binding protein sre1 [Grosmannia clavigera kw1407]